MPVDTTKKRRQKRQIIYSSVKAGFHMIAMIAAIAKKKFSDRCDHRETTLQRSHAAIVATTIPEIDLSSISTIVAIVAIIWKPLSRDCSDRRDEKYTGMQYVAVCFRSSRAFFNSVAVVAIIWKLVVVRVAQRFCSDRSDHMETSLKLALIYEHIN